MNNSTKEEKKITLHVMIEGGRSFTEEYVVKQKIQVVINKTLEKLNLNTTEPRQLLRGDSTQIIDFNQTIEDVALTNNETLKFVLKSAPKPDEPKKFA